MYTYLNRDLKQTFSCRRCGFQVQATKADSEESKHTRNKRHDLKLSTEEFDIFQIAVFEMIFIK